MHLFCFCLVAQRVWTFVLNLGRRLWLISHRPQTINTEWMNVLWWFPSRLLHNTNKNWNTILAIMWKSIWNARCMAKFEGTQFTAEFVTTLFKCYLGIWLSASMNKRRLEKQFAEWTASWGNSKNTWQISKEYNRFKVTITISTEELESKSTTMTDRVSRQ